jgi:5'-3' exonuclease
MGIPHYFYVITQNYPGILCNQLKQVDHVFIDFNGLIHSAAYAVLSNFESGDVEAPSEAIEEAICFETWNLVKQCTDNTSPSKRTYICTDGVAPLAKISQQRKRRYLSCFNARNESAVWDRNAISPYTPFMNDLSKYVTSAIEKNGGSFYYSDAKEPGEGEHKIFEILASLPEADTKCVHGLDADLIMLSLCSHVPNITLIRENHDGTLQFLDITALRHGIIEDVRTKYKWNVPAQQDVYSATAKAVIETYVVLCFLHGNDFIPHMISLPLKGGGYGRLLHAAGHAYMQHPSGLVSNSAIQSDFLLAVLEYLQKDEDSTVVKMLEDYHHKRPMSDNVDLYPLRHKDPLVEKMLMNPKSWRSMYYRSLFWSRDTSVIKDACRMFIAGIHWTYAYYKRLPKDSMYMYPYGYAPTILDLYNYLSTSPELSLGTTSTTHIDPIVQLMIILPPQSKHLLPSDLHPLIDDPRHGCAHMFASGYEVQTFLKTYLWECNPVLPAVDVPLLHKCVSDIRSHDTNKSKQ